MPSSPVRSAPLPDAIRPARASDLAQIEAIRRSVALDRGRLDDKAYLAKIRRTGFLLQTDVRADDIDGTDARYLVFDLGGDILGYCLLVAEPEIAPDLAPVSWFDDECRVRYLSSPHAGLGVIAVAPESRRRKVAAGLLRAAEAFAAGRNAARLYSLVVSAPLENGASIAWHESNGFARIGKLGPNSYGGLEHECIIYEKELGGS